MTTDAKVGSGIVATRVVAHSGGSLITQTLHQEPDCSWFFHTQVGEGLELIESATDDEARAFLLANQIQPKPYI